MIEIRKIERNKIAAKDSSAITSLIKNYKQAIGEAELTPAQYAELNRAIAAGEITFFLAFENDILVAMCSLSKTFSTFSCSYSGVFEDFYILPEYRGKGLAKLLTKHVFDYCTANGITSLWVGSADCDLEMYKHLGFALNLGNLLTWTAE